MATYFINTDAVSYGGHSYHAAWLARGIAVTSGLREYRQKLDRVRRGDAVLMYVNQIGVIAAGIVLDDHPVDVRDDHRVSQDNKGEYHRCVAWLTLPTEISPGTLRKLCGRPPRGTVERVCSGEDELRQLLPAELFSPTPGEAE
jgi:hypothetical protein